MSASWAARARGWSTATSKDNDFEYFLKLIKPCRHDLTVCAECIACREFTLLKTIPGIGESSGLTILCEIGDIERFPTIRDFLAYCRLVKGTVASAGKIKGLHKAQDLYAVSRAS